MNKTSLLPSVRRTRRYRKFPYVRVAKMWKKGRTIAEIARAVNVVDKDNPNGDLYHSLRNFLYRMHRGYKDEQGCFVRLPHRVRPKTVRLSRKAGLRAW